MNSVQISINILGKYSVRSIQRNVNLIGRKLTLDRGFHSSTASWIHRSPMSGQQESQSGQEDDVIIESINGKGIITLNRPKALNALNLSMIKKITPVLKDWEGSKKFVIIKGQGEKAFCAGGDVRAVTESAKVGGDLYKDFFRGEYLLNSLIGTLHIPYIALINGITMGGGVGLSIHGRYRVATERTLFAMPETAIGLFPDVGGSHILPRLGGKLGLFLALTGYRLKGIDNVRAGIATHICSSEALPYLEQDLISLDAANSNPANIEEVLQRYTERCPESKKPFTLEENIAKIDKIFSGNTVEDIIANLKADSSKWSLDLVETLSKMSPTSLKVTKKLLDVGSELDLQECLRIEYRISQRCCETPDFIEGVRALLVDKDQNPKWNPSTLDQVSDSYVDSYFKTLPSDRELSL